MREMRALSPKPAGPPLTPMQEWVQAARSGDTQLAADLMSKMYGNAATHVDMGSSSRAINRPIGSPSQLPAPVAPARRLDPSPLRSARRSPSLSPGRSPGLSRSPLRSSGWWAGVSADALPTVPPQPRVRLSPARSPPQPSSQQLGRSSLPARAQTGGQQPDVFAMSASLLPGTLERERGPARARAPARAPAPQAAATGSPFLLFSRLSTAPPAVSQPRGFGPASAPARTSQPPPAQPQPAASSAGLYPGLSSAAMPPRWGALSSAAAGLERVGQLNPLPGAYVYR